MFFYTRYPSAATLKAYFPDVRVRLPSAPRPLHPSASILRG